jgi:hypothetical protein
MQTFLCHLLERIAANGSPELLHLLTECFEKTAKTLDYRRLGKQRVEANQLLNVILKRVRIDDQYKSFDEARKLLEEHDQSTWPFSTSYDLTKKRVTKPGWRSHPAVSMWADYPEVLKLYFNCMVKEWKFREYRNTMLFEDVDHSKLSIPPFLQNSEFLQMMRGNLIRKDKEFYGKLWPDVEPENGYLWYSKGEYRLIVNKN